MKKYLQLVDTNTQGPRYDVSPLFADAGAFSALVDDICSHFDPTKFDYVGGIDALGFILGGAVAIRCNKGFIAVRKGGKLPVETESVSFVDYSGEDKSLEIRTDLFSPGDRVLLVDEWIETGTQVTAAVSLIESQQGVITGIATICMDENPATLALRNQYACYQAWD